MNLEARLISSIVLVCGVLASLAVGVLIAYGVCLGLFGMLKMRAQRVGAADPSQRSAARVSVLGS